MSEARIQSFEEFWPFYVGEHKDPRSRALHYVGTTLAIGTVAAAALTVNPTWLLLTPIVGYTPAWIGHFIIEKNRPATFKYPVWSLRGDLRMLSYALAGKMADEVERLHPVAGRKPHGVAAAAPAGTTAAPEKRATGATHGTATNGVAATA
jgi:hypothetical protein